MKKNYITRPIIFTYIHTQIRVNIYMGTFCTHICRNYNTNTYTYGQAHIHTHTHTHTHTHIRTLIINTGLSPYDDERYVLNDKITTLAHGYYCIGFDL